jgi:hypothetical protein
LPVILAIGGDAQVLRRRAGLSFDTAFDVRMTGALVRAA